MYFPTTCLDHSRPIERVTCMWKEPILKFVIVSKMFSTEEEFEIDAVDVFLKQIKIFPDLLMMERTSHVIPLTNNNFLQQFKQYAVEQLGESIQQDVQQLCSGESFVIETDRLILKSPFFDNERNRLTALFATCDSDKPNLSLYPCRLYAYGNNIFFAFTKCRFKPLSKDKAQSIMIYRRFWMQGLLNAIEELHRCKIAHFV